MNPANIDCPECGDSARDHGNAVCWVDRCECSYDWDAFVFPREEES